MCIHTSATLIFSISQPHRKHRFSRIFFHLSRMLFSQDTAFLQPNINKNSLIACNLPLKLSQNYHVRSKLTKMWGREVAQVSCSKTAVTLIPFCYVVGRAAAWGANCLPQASFSGCNYKSSACLHLYSISLADAHFLVSSEGKNNNRGCVILSEKIFR